MLNGNKYGYAVQLPESMNLELREQGVFVHSLQQDNMQSCTNQYFLDFLVRDFARVLPKRHDMMFFTFLSSFCICALSFCSPVWSRLQAIFKHSSAEPRSGTRPDEDVRTTWEVFELSMSENMTLDICGL